MARHLFRFEFVSRHRRLGSCHQIPSFIAIIVTLKRLAQDEVGIVGLLDFHGDELHRSVAPTLDPGGAACKSDGRYFSWMAKKDRKPKARPFGDKWFVYIVRCADGSFYTGISKDVKRRCQQHNAGTASRYTRSRRPVKLIYQEVRPDQSSALKQEAAIKAMTRRAKLAMIRVRKKAG